jgi:hypothetical protein
LQCNPFFVASNPAQESINEVKSEILQIKQELKKMTISLETCEAEIKTASENVLKNPGSLQLYWITKEQALRTKEQALRNEKQALFTMLIEKEAELRMEKKEKEISGDSKKAVSGTLICHFD